jgi:hypothetical protein
MRATASPSTGRSVRAFLAEFLSDPYVVDLPRWLWLPVLHGIVLRSRPARVAEQYSSVWSAAGSPLRAATERLAADVHARAAGRFEVSTAYRYGEPSIDSAMQRLAREHASPVIVIPLFPQRTDATTGTTLRRAREAAARAGISDQLIERVIDPADTGYVAAMATRWREALAEAPHPLDHGVRTWSTYSWGGSSTFLPRNLGNSTLGPERTSETELGFDAATPGERLKVGFSWYRRDTRDALFAVRNAPSTGGWGSGRWKANCLRQRPGRQL